MNLPILSCLKQGIHFLESTGVPEPKISAEQLLSYVLRSPVYSLYLESKKEIDNSLQNEFQSLLAKRALRCPLQYLLQEIPFRNALFKVGEGCLIPRPETEILVEAVLKRLGRESEILEVLDVGTGSGNIAVSLAQERPKWRITATDLSDETLRYAKVNADQNNVGNRIRFIETNLLDDVVGSFHAIVSNPPYLNEREMETLQPEVLYEPRFALDGGPDGLSFFYQIVNGAKKILKPEGFIFFEIGANHAAPVSKILRRNGYTSIRLSQDDLGIPRIISGRLSKTKRHSRSPQNMAQSVRPRGRISPRSLADTF